MLYILVQASTAAILVLSANTAFADFPRLSGIIAMDGFLPRQLASRGATLVLSNGVAMLAVLAGGLFVAFNGNTTSLIPLFAVGLFMSFTLSQAGMMVHHHRQRSPGWRWKHVVNIVGTVATAAVTVIVVISKFTEGAWIPTTLIPLLVLLFTAIHRHYAAVADELRVLPGTALTSGLETSEHQHSPRHRHVAVSGALPSPVALHRSLRLFGGGRRSHRSPAGVCGSTVVGARVIEPIGAVVEGPSAVSAQHRRGVCTGFCRPSPGPTQHTAITPCVRELAQAAAGG